MKGKWWRVTVEYKAMNRGGNDGEEVGNKGMLWDE